MACLFQQGQTVDNAHPTSCVTVHELNHVAGCVKWLICQFELMVPFMHITHACEAAETMRAYIHVRCLFS